MHVAEKHNRILILIRGKKITFGYIVHLFLLAFFYLMGACYQSLPATLSPYCISLPNASMLSVISAYTVSNK